MWKLERLHMKPRKIACEDSENCMWRLGKLHVKTRKIACENLENCVWKLGKLRVKTWKFACENLENCMWKLGKLHVKTWTIERNLFINSPHSFHMCFSLFPAAIVFGGSSIISAKRRFGCWACVFGHWISGWRCWSRRLASRCLRHTQGQSWAIDGRAGYSKREERATGSGTKPSNVPLRGNNISGSRGCLIHSVSHLGRRAIISGSCFKTTHFPNSVYRFQISLKSNGAISYQRTPMSFP